jgi:alpha-amylase
MELSKIAKEHGVGLYWDAVLNHKAGADKTEKCRAVEVDNEDRTKEVGEPYEIEGWLGFDFPGRGDKYSSMKYHWEHFSGTDYNQANEKKAIYKIVGDNKGWSNSVDNEGGNADYMMFADIDYRHPDVQEDVKNWGVWITKELGLKGFRLDAVQHFSERFTNDWIENVREQCGKDIFMVG